MTETEMIAKVAEIPKGSRVFVSYLAGRKPTLRAIREAERARQEGLNLRHFVGTFTDMWVTRKGETVFTVLSDTRDDERRGTNDGYRTFNPNLGVLLSVDLVEESP